MRLNLTGSGKKKKNFLIHICFSCKFCPYKERTRACSRNYFWRVRGLQSFVSSSYSNRDPEQFQNDSKSRMRFQHISATYTFLNTLQDLHSTFLSALAKQATTQECSETGHGPQVVLMFPPLYKRDKSGSVEASCARGHDGLQPWLLMQASLCRGASAWLALE